MNGYSQNPKDVLIDKLKNIIPEAFTENKIDWEKIRAALGEDIEFSNERYVLNWAGKSEAFKVLQSPTSRTLIPCKDESVKFDETGNVFIEGENLEVLKLLQKSYFGKIKMIYIDPPYNTGNDSFIYPDKFAETKEEYQKRVGDKDDEGYMTKEGMFRKNSKENGQYHSNWLNMIYPRLFLARNLLRDDGVIFVSIDDNEVHNLRMVMNEVFGEENFVANIVWKHTQQSKNDELHFSRHHNSIIVYSKVKNKLENFRFDRTDEDNKNYSNTDNDPKGLWRSGDVRSPSFRKTLCYKIITPNGKIINAPENGWRWSEEEVKNKILSGEIIFNKDETNIIRKIYLIDQEGRTPENLWDGDEFGTTRSATSILKELFGDFSPFDTPKPIQLIKKIMSLLKFKEYLILDFFSGSGTTAHAVLDLNKEDGGNRKFICVQLDEKCDEKSEAHKAGYKTIADIGKERIRRVIKKINEETMGVGTRGLSPLLPDDQSLFSDDTTRGYNPLFPEKKHDLGFKAFKLADSNFKIWRTDGIKTADELEKELNLFTDPVAKGAVNENIAYELLIKSGFDLNSKIEYKDSIFIIDDIKNDSQLIFMLDKADEMTIKKVLELKPQKVIILDRLFEKNDQLKTNTALQMRDAGIELKTV